MTYGGLMPRRLATCSWELPTVTMLGVVELLLQWADHRVVESTSTRRAAPTAGRHAPEAS